MKKEQLVKIKACECRADAVLCLHGWQANKKRTCAQPVSGRAMPENEIPPAMPVDFYFNISKCIKKSLHFLSCRLP